MTASLVLASPFLVAADAAATECVLMQSRHLAVARSSPGFSAALRASHESHP